MGKTYSIKVLRRDLPPCGQPRGNVQSLGDLFSATNNLEGSKAGSQAGTVAEKTNPLALECGRLNVRHQAGKTSPDTATVHVAAVGTDLASRLDTLLELLLGQGHEGLLDDLVGQRLLVVHVLDLLGNLSKGGALRVDQEVVVQKASIRLLDQLAGRGVEGNIVEAIQRGLDIGSTVAIGVAVLQLLLPRVVGLVGGVQSLAVAVDGVVAVNVRVLAGKVGLVEVVGVLHVRSTQTGLSNDGGVRADQHGNAASATGGTRVALGVKGNVASHNNGIPAVPGGRLDPVDGVEKGVGASVARVDGVNTLDVGVVAEQLHEDRLAGLGLVQEGLCADLEAANGVGVDLVLLEEVGNGGQSEGVDVWEERVS